ncbi:unnamed protein product [marine sediment metagenome]|uniref:Uncharacterized protein n=1 Tax=marine sediment metagenome TaxID=412755 RepID=X0RVB0_9ZZZZ
MGRDTEVYEFVVSGGWTFGKPNAGALLYEDLGSEAGEGVAAPNVFISARLARGEHLHDRYLGARVRIEITLKEE